MTAYCLGIDIGTTSIKIALFDYSTNKVVLFKAREHDALIHFLNGTDQSLKMEQSAIKIFKTLHTLLCSLDPDFSAKISRIAICGQMHGVILWGRTFHEHVLLSDEAASKFSNLITWEDKRCTPEFLDSLPKTETSYTKIHAGRYVLFNLSYLYLNFCEYLLYLLKPSFLWRMTVK